MAITELAAIEAAYQALQPLSPGARRRAVRWLSDALETEEDLTDLSGVPAAAPFTTEPAALPAGLTDPDPADIPADPPAAAPAAARPGRGRRAAARAGAPATGVRTDTPAVPPRQRRRSGRPDNDRAYRRMPTADEVMTAYRSVGTVTGLARYFDVPTHTVQGWARRLRGQGYQIGRGARDA